MTPRFVDLRLELRVWTDRQADEYAELLARHVARDIDDNSPEDWPDTLVIDSEGTERTPA